ncbi:DUF2127 domain-containing protein [Mycolicibacterium porcinum]|uniref:DUF2127 domain-containing protein n=1 Tax=Mycolicibacterium porcinum TaxID=39693 RepID=A0AAW5T876_9MYCO|nr:DUF2127 domain-containing protein [Mycolicibacterium porcinum]MBX8689254.1 DUF2127 domain-containing protein [Mycobacterium sp. 20091114027_K0903767]CDO29295.1 membrane protein [Mycolicibacterium vulneris]MCV7390622.1 DUF2127 domain-containing protein [Mycolicibacterium porcinum]ODR18611.1 hypothetical protein BHQ19_26380 [Mycolicibacterium porcinum]ORB36884.1 hypothetical protein BST41_24525 [Mycolicibacterium porcinum]
MVDFALRSCGLRGHATFAPDEPELRERLRVETPVGEAWRCLRCETFVVGPPRGHGPADTAPEIPRGRLLRDRTLMRLLAVERAVRGVVFVLLAAGILKVRASQSQLKDAFEKDIPLMRPLADQIGWNIDDSKIVRHIGEAFTLSSTTLLWIAVGVAAYALIEFIEAVGLWLMKRWGEYFAVIATGVFLPLEIYELTEKVTVLRLGALAINLAAVIWLLWSKRLFGINGGGEAYRAEHHTESLLSVERAGLAAPDVPHGRDTGTPTESRHRTG